MTVFIDTNVILDYVLRREHYAEAKETIVKLVAAGDKMLMSSIIRSACLTPLATKSSETTGLRVARRPS